MTKLLAHMCRSLVLTVVFLGVTTCVASAADSSFVLVAPDKVEPGQYFSVTAKLNTENLEIYGAEVTLRFNPTVVKLAYSDLKDNYQQGSGLRSSLVIPRSKQGEITYSIGLTKPVKGEDLEVVTFNLRAKEDGMAQLTLPNVKITKILDNKLVESTNCTGTGATVQIGNGTKPSTPAPGPSGPPGGPSVPTQGTVTIPGTSTSGAGFIDLPQGYWANADIASLVYRQIITGFPDGSFKPKQVTTRAQLAVMLTKALNLPAADPAKAGFQDVTSTHWASSSIAAVAEAGLLQGYQSKFRPNDPVSREELVVIVVRALNWQNDKVAQPTGTREEKLKQFKDLSQIPAWAREAVGQSLELDLVRGVQTDRFGAGQKATREQVAVLVNKVLNLREAQ